MLPMFAFEAQQNCEGPVEAVELQAPALGEHPPPAELTQ
jgi:hypothetical protein